jgi:hypothetical protein
MRIDYIKNLHLVDTPHKAKILLNQMQTKACKDWWNTYGDYIQGFTDIKPNI